MPEVATNLAWVERNSLSMVAWEAPGAVEELHDAVGTKLDGSSVAASSMKRSRRVLNVAMEHAMKQGTLRANPVPKGEAPRRRPPPSSTNGP